MTPELFNLRINAGKKAGRESACGKKVAYPTEERAAKAALALNAKPTTRKKLEGYPCAFCAGWHVGREMPVEEMRTYVGEPPKCTKECGAVFHMTGHRHVEGCEAYTNGPICPTCGAPRPDLHPSPHKPCPDAFHKAAP